VRTCWDNNHETRHNPADWKGFEFVSSDSCKSKLFRRASDLVSKLYEKADTLPYSNTYTAHIIFLAAAEALLSNSIPKMLQSLGIETSLPKDSIYGNGVEYIVFDSDETIAANYCEIILANRITRIVLDRRILEKIRSVKTENE
jgi:hypothetical protein